MNDEIEVTREDVLAGLKLVKVKLRDGTTTSAMVKALPWRLALITGAMFAKGEIAEGVIKTLQHSLNAKEEWLDSLVPSELTRLANIAQQLSNGIPEKNGSAGTPEASPASETSGKSNVSCENAAMPMPAN